METGDRTRIIAGVEKLAWGKGEQNTYIAALTTPFPWQLKPGERWTREMRHAQANVLKDVLALEKEAIAHVQAAVPVAR